MRRAKFITYLTKVKFCVSNGEARERGSWDVSDEERRQALEDFIAMLERNGYEIIRHEASAHQILQEMVA